MNYKALFLIFFTIYLLPADYLRAQQQPSSIARAILAQDEAFDALPLTRLLEPASSPDVLEKDLSEEVGTASFWRMDANAIKAILTKGPGLLNLSLPAPAAGPMSLRLERREIFSSDFKVSAASNRNVPVDFKKGGYYWGIVNGDPNSLVAITITEEEVSGLIHRGGTTFNLGRVPGKNEGLHILYQVEELKNPPPADCFTDDFDHLIGGAKQPSGSGDLEKAADNCVRMYVEVDYDIFVGKGGLAQAADYVAAVFNQVAILYANESIDFTLSELLVWDVEDPYSGSSTLDYLYAFRDNLAGNYNGDLAHLVGYRGSGGVAYVDALCNKYYGVGYSDINPTYSEVPTYSWTVEVVTHEIGHNLGSRHTHACAWNGNNTAIDGCGPAAGYSEGCDAPVPDKGTIMSYCHLVSGVGIDFNLGFGPQPGDLIRNRVNNASCLTACGAAAANDAGITAVVSPVGTLCTDAESPVVELTNFGTEPLTSVAINYRLDDNPVNTYAWSGTLASGASTQIALPLITFSAGSHTLTATTLSPNGQTDESPVNDQAGGSFVRDTEQLYYADTDADGYGDPNNSVLDCSAPAGYVLDNTDCNDNDGSAYPGAPCNDGEVCTTGDVLDANCQCSGTISDSDGDGVCDGLDVCPGGDDTIDSDGDGTPDLCDCDPAVGTFPGNQLSHNGTGASSTSYSFETGSKNATFSISGLDAQLSGNPRGRYEEEVTVTYIDENGNTRNYGSFSGADFSTVAVSIQTGIREVTVSLRDGYDGSAPQTMAVTFSVIDYCNAASLCPDSDGDGVCDSEDICPNGDDSIDTDGDGTPDACDSSDCVSDVFDDFSPNPLTHVGNGSSTSILTFGGANSDVRFSITNLTSQISGKPENRYIEEVTITYLDAGDVTRTYGTFNGEETGQVDVMISGVVKSITVALRDIYSGNSTSTLSVDLGRVSSCAALPGNISQAPRVGRIGIFPNPTQNTALLEFGETPESALVIVTDLLGAQVASYQVQEEPELLLNTRNWSTGSQLYLVRIYLPGRAPVTRRLVVAR